MRDNPFSPSFSIRPERFYGRRTELDMMESALGNPDSPNRYLFLTGTRGCGKTSLLHQFALIAGKMGWDVLETTYQDALEALRAFAGVGVAVGTSREFNPSLSVGGVSASAVRMTKSVASEPTEHLAQALVGNLGKRRSNGLFIAIDEVQKIGEAAMEEISHAVQAAKTAGCDISLVIAGLPGAYAKIRRYPGCTFVQRMRRCMLGMMGVQETKGFLRFMFALVPEIELGDEELMEVAQFSSGHPYLLQLVGSCLYEVASEIDVGRGSKVVLGPGQVREAERRALPDYRENVLENLLIGMHEGTREYLRALCALCDEQSTARSADVAEAMGKTLAECSKARARVIDLQLALPAGRGKLRLALPYLSLVFSESEYEQNLARHDAWIPRKDPFA